MNQPSQDPLAEACRRGGDDAFAELYRTFADGVFHVVSRILHDREDATDALQETFLTAFRRIETFRGDGSLKAWLHRIGVHVAFRIRRRRRTQPSLDAEAAFTPEAPAEAPHDADFHAMLQQEIDRLPERARLVFVLHTVEEHTHAQIAEVLGISEGTSKSQLSYARGLLRRRLERFDDGSA